MKLEHEDFGYEVEFVQAQENKGLAFRIYVPTEELEMADDSLVQTIIEGANQVACNQDPNLVVATVSISETPKSFEENKVALRFDYRYLTDTGGDLKDPTPELVESIEGAPKAVLTREQWDRYCEG